MEQHQRHEALVGGRGGGARRDAFNVNYVSQAAGKQQGGGTATALSQQAGLVDRHQCEGEVRCVGEGMLAAHLSVSAAAPCP